MEDIVLNKRKILLMLSRMPAIALVLYAGQQLLTVKANLGDLHFEPFDRTPNPGAIQCSKILELNTSRSHTLPWFSVRRGNYNGDYSVDDMARYNRLTGILQIWAKGTSGWASHSEWGLVREFGNVTDAEIAMVAKNSEPIHLIVKYGAVDRTPRRKQR